MNNKDNYKKAIDQIHASETLKEKTIQKINARKNKNKVVFLKILSACAVFVFALLIGNEYIKTNETPVEPNKAPIAKEVVKTPSIALNKSLPRFESIEQLKEVLKENNTVYYNSSTLDMAEATADLASATDTQNAVAKKSRGSGEYSTTNVQVENVDEADIVKTDGNYIYYITQGIAYIIKADNLEIVKEFEVTRGKESFRPYELFVNGNKLILIGNYSTYEEVESSEKRLYTNRIYTQSATQAIVYDVSDKANPTEVRTVRLDGSYRNSRMIGNNVYLISTKSAYYADNGSPEVILPRLYDSSTGETLIEATDIAYFKGTDSNTFMTVAGFDINNEQGVCSETFYGAGDLVYASENNLYLTQSLYDWESGNVNKTTIYKFKLDGSKIELLCKGEVKGSLNNQFSMDEYDGNLRVATTLYTREEESSNSLYILNDKLEQIGQIEDMAIGEKIYSVRFMEKIGYIVTFEQIDPLFVIDLSNPNEPEIEGQLKIPGYSSYLHPYDETHIIGIGHNTKPNGHGGVTDSTMKMSMFDVSDLSNPKEMFNIEIGDYYASSNVLYNHKALFEHKGKDLIGFQVTYRNYRSNDDKDAFALFHIDLEKGFERYGEISHEIDYRTNIDRAIYIGDKLYTLAEYEIRSYNLDNLEELQKLEFEEESESEDAYLETKSVLIDY